MGDDDVVSSDVLIMEYILSPRGIWYYFDNSMLVFGCWFIVPLILLQFWTHSHTQSHTGLAMTIAKSPTVPQTLISRTSVPPDQKHISQANQHCAIWSPDLVFRLTSQSPAPDLKIKSQTKELAGTVWINANKGTVGRISIEEILYMHRGLFQKCKSK